MKPSTYSIKTVTIDLLRRNIAHDIKVYLPMSINLLCSAAKYIAAQYFRLNQPPGGTITTKALE
jgi:hypothetical protein